MIPAFPVYLFDIDGTLLDSAADICGAVEDLIGEPERAGWNRERISRYIGLHLMDLFRAIYPRWSPEQIDGMVERYRERYHVRGHSATRLYPGVHETLAGLPGRKATATSRRAVTARALLEQFDLARYFNHIQGMDGLRSKPAPDILLASLEVLGAKPSECLMVGDAPADIEAGRRAGIVTCAVDYGYGDPGALGESGADYRISDLRELLTGAGASAGR